MLSNVVQAEALEFLLSLPDKSWDVVVTSPPYNIGVPYEGYLDKRSDYLDWSESWIREAIRVTKQGVMLNIGGKASDQNSLYRLLGRLAEHFVIQQTWVWVKSISVGGKTTGHFKPINSSRFCNNVHEFVVLVNSTGSAVLDKLSIGVPFEDKSNIARFSGNDGRDVRDRGSTWFLPYETRVERLSHPATYPVELAEWMIRISNSRRILDPFVGSGTTAVACKKLGLDFSGCDISETYVQQALKRLGN